MKPVIIVTGGANNIGRAISDHFLTSHRVVVADIAEPATPLAGDGVFIQTDITNSDQVASLYEQAAGLGPLQALVHSAAISAPARPIHDIDLAEWRRIIEVNLTGAFIVSQAAIAHLRPGTGSITLLTSRAAKTGYAALNVGSGGTKPHYCASKAGVISLMKSLATELAPEIRVNAVAPGPIEGEMIPQEKWADIAARVPLGRLGAPSEIAAAVAFLVSPAAGFITGHVLDVNGGTLMD
ncbi:MAG TPA: SDR family NAD(P)-dependent oxidoreductase [Burkholderiaceae bacterium]|nr:SDR family NAD(P)-dependent oxidoreductase [Burkholderiaceae bacterium]